MKIVVYDDEGAEVLSKFDNQGSEPPAVEVKVFTEQDLERLKAGDELATYISDIFARIYAPDSRGRHAAISLKDLSPTAKSKLGRAMRQVNGAINNLSFYGGVKEMFQDEIQLLRRVKDMAGEKVTA